MYLHIHICMYMYMYMYYHIYLYIATYYTHTHTHTHTGDVERVAQGRDALFQDCRHAGGRGDSRGAAGGGDDVSGAGHPAHGGQKRPGVCVCVAACYTYP